MSKIKISIAIGCAILICVGIMFSCNKQDNKITDQIFPNTTVEKSAIDPKYKDVAYELSEDGIKEFYKIDKVPRVSGHPEAMRNYLLQWGNEHKVNTFLDTSGCVIMDVPATSGCENYPKILLQAHFDMVGATTDSSIDMINSPIDLEYDDNTGVIHSKDYKTSIGADNGTGVVTLLELAKNKNLVHGPLRLIYTYDEETTMEGAKNLSKEILDADNIINLDGFYAGQIVYASAGSYKTLVEKQYNLEPTTDTSTIEINVDGLKGGHSAIQIAKKVINANILMRDIMDDISSNDIAFNIVDFSGGNAANAIAGSGNLKIAVNNEDKDAAIDLINNRINSAKHNCTDENVDAQFDVDVTNENESALSQTDSLEVLNILKELPYGVKKINEDEKYIPITSINIGVVKFDNGKISIYSHARSSEEATITRIAIVYEHIYKTYNYDFKLLNRYPAFEEGKDKSLLNLALNSYKDVMGVEAKALAIHVGLESSWLYNKRPDARIITVGADSTAQHSPQECFYTKSFPHYFASLAYILDNINTI